MLVVQFLTHPIQMKWISTTPTLEVALYLRPSSWQGWIKLFEIICELYSFANHFLEQFADHVE